MRPIAGPFQLLKPAHNGADNAMQPRRADRHLPRNQLFRRSAIVPRDQRRPPIAFAVGEDRRPELSPRRRFLLDLGALEKQRDLAPDFFVVPKRDGWLEPADGERLTL